MLIKSKLMLVCSIFTLAVTTAMIPSEDIMADAASDCPAFTPAMIDAAAMAFRLWQGVGVRAEDDPTIPTISCHLTEGGINHFVLEVNLSGLNSAFVYGEHQAEGDPNFDTELYSYAEDLSLGQMNACRRAVLKSFVWKNYCAPALP